MKYWQFGETMLEKLNRENHEQKQKKNTGIYGRGTGIQTVHETPCIQKGPPMSDAF